MLFDTHLTEEFDALRDTVKRMCDADLAPRAAEIDEKNEFPADMWKKLGELGLLGMTVPEEYGGTGLGYTRARGGDGGSLARLGLGGPCLRRALQPVREQPLPQRQRGAAAQVPAEALLRASSWARWR